MLKLGSLNWHDGLLGLDEAQAYRGHGQERGTTELLSREVRSATWVDCLDRSIGKINRNIFSGALQLFRFMVRIVHYGRSTTAYSETLYFLFRNFRMRVWKKARRGIHWPKVQVGGGGERENRRTSISFFFSRSLLCTCLVRALSNCQNKLARCRTVGKRENVCRQATSTNLPIVHKRFIGFFVYSLK